MYRINDGHTTPSGKSLDDITFTFGHRDTFNKFIRKDSTQTSEKGITKTKTVNKKFTFV